MRLPGCQFWAGHAVWLLPFMSSRVVTVRAVCLWCCTFTLRFKVRYLPPFAENKWRNIQRARSWTFFTGMPFGRALTHVPAYAEESSCRKQWHTQYDWLYTAQYGAIPSLCIALIGKGVTLSYYDHCLKGPDCLPFFHTTLWPNPCGKLYDSISTVCR